MEPSKIDLLHHLLTPPMALHQNSQLLVNHLEALPLLEGRFEQLKLVNFDSVNDKKRGCFSLVFRAIDRITGNPVALKFFDLDPQWFHNPYRRSGFVREHQLLETLLTKGRCLQLVAGLSTYELPTGGPNGFMVPCQYFATEWLDVGIDDYFLTSKHSAVKRLFLLLDVILAVEALHRNEIFHRDLKADNLRAAADRVVVAIDLGTAARFDSGPILPAYGGSVGAPAYAPMEARAGLAGNRTLAKFSDIYAIGCLLFELFNPDYFYARLVSKNPQYEMNLMAMGMLVNGVTDENAQVKAWDDALDKHALGVTTIEIDSAGSDVPAGIAPMLNQLLATFTHVDYRRRPQTLDAARKRIQAAIKVLENQKLYDGRLKQARERKNSREAKLAQKSARRKAKQVEISK
ncbi:protein kinase family protein [Burkholderia cepacia]|uniref:Protein kinase n=2 Tax=Burkholderia cepacia TaxID=292 RepID=A0A8I1AJ70_BURCE|nr:protein kinase family protein [Burkholderia cepacia]MBH9680766.1 protein kinase [Burkholderia cepacia]MBH9695371.1 protein kinase [Burkholderia cepacia]MBH9711383.1 protein kinase [Burkholderia cepacia]MBH9731394.1 protein kinase [Burkholderia cepacia]MBX3757574.1 protein kinase family protein [Burkholderia cepacia]